MRCADKVLSKHAMTDAGLPTPEFYSFTETAFKELGAAEALPAIEERLEFPIVVKPADQGSALGVRFARAPADVPQALIAAFSYSQVRTRAPRARARARRLDPRRRAAAGGRGGPTRGGLLRLSARYTIGRTSFVCPAQLGDRLTEHAQALALDVFRLLGCRGGSRGWTSCSRRAPTRSRCSRSTRSRA